METIGVSLFESVSCRGSEAATTAPRRELRRPPAVVMETAILEAPDVPEPLWPVLGSSLDGLIWRSLLDGVEHYPIALTRHAKGDLRLLKLQPGARIPMHGHDGEEHTLVLRGECEDAYGRYTPGDFTDLDDDTQHSVVGVGDQPCIILIGSETTPKFLPKHG